MMVAPAIRLLSDQEPNVEVRRLPIHHSGSSGAMHAVRTTARPTRYLTRIHRSGLMARDRQKSSSRFPRSRQVMPTAVKIARNPPSGITHGEALKSNPGL